MAIQLDFALSATLMTGAGAFTAATCTTLSPLGGAVFGISTFLSSRIIDWTVTQACCCCKGNPIFTISKCTLSIFGGIAAAIVATKAVGFPLTFTAGLVLSNAMLAAAIATFFVKEGCLCISWIVTTFMPRADNTSNTTRV